MGKNEPVEDERVARAATVVIVCTKIPYATAMEFCDYTDDECKDKKHIMRVLREVDKIREKGILPAIRMAQRAAAPGPSSNPPTEANTVSLVTAPRSRVG